MAKNELLESRDDRKSPRRDDVAVFGGLKGVLRLEKMLKEGGEANALASGAMGLGKKGSFANWLKAQDLTATGKSSDEVWNETGWFQHPIDKGWRMEIPDANAKFDFDKFMELTDEKKAWAPHDEYLQNKWGFVRDKLKEKGIDVPASGNMSTDITKLSEALYDKNNALDWRWVKDLRDEANKTFGSQPPMPKRPTLDQIIDHSELFQIYPELRGVQVQREWNPLYRGSYNEETNRLALKPAAEYGDPGSGPLSTGLHEIQHGIQSIEDLERGANPGAVSQDFIGQMEEFFNKSTPAQLSDDDFLKAIMEFETDPRSMGYRRSIGETEARNVQKRLRLLQRGFTPRDLELNNPLGTMDVPANAQYRLNELLTGFGGQ
ncbi:hypothetical protein M0Q28_05860 [Patescibacteria group bacterium]|nr:hypothetical protein [Patescibacteria group bacterium]